MGRRNWSDATPVPSSYLKFAIDFEGYGRRDLIHSPLNALASTANYLKSYGWTSNQPWTEGSSNFHVLQKWNDSEVYAKTVAISPCGSGKNLRSLGVTQRIETSLILTVCLRGLD